MRSSSAAGRLGRQAVVLTTLLVGPALLSLTATAEPVSVRFAEGTVHGFLSLHAPDGSVLASGDLVQVPGRSAVTTELVFRFKDGSIHRETATFSQRGRFRLVRYRLVQKGPAFPRSLDMSIDAAGGRVRVEYTDEQGKARTVDEHLDLPADLANGLIPILLKNVTRAALPKALSLVVATPKPRLVQLSLSLDGRDAFRTGGEGREAEHFVLKVEIGGLAGWFASLAGKKPPDSHVWILEGRAPAFVRSEQPFYAGGPLWRIDLASPSW